MSNLPPMVIHYAPATVPTANQKFFLIDSTRLLVETWAASTTLPSTAGSYRGNWARQRVDWNCLCTTNNITITRQIWMDEWVDAPTVGSITASHTITAGTVTNHGWVPETPDWRIYGLIGATAPGAIVFMATVDRDDLAAGTG